MRSTESARGQTQRSSAVVVYAATFGAIAFIAAMTFGMIPGGRSHTVAQTYNSMLNADLDKNPSSESVQVR